MFFRDLFVLLLASTCGFSQGMDMGESPFSNVPFEVVTLIVNHAGDRDKGRYPMYDDRGDTEFLVIPYTLRSIDLVKKEYASTEILAERTKKEVFLNHQLWTSQESYSAVRLRRERADADDRYELDISGLNLPKWMTTEEPTEQDIKDMLKEFIGEAAEQHGSDQEDDPMELSDSDENKNSSGAKQGFGGSKLHAPKIWFDGINNVNAALVGMTDLKATEPKSIFFLLKQSEGNATALRTVMHNESGKHLPFLQLDGVLKSVLLHPECNRVMCVVIQGNVSQLHIGEVHDDNSYLPLDLQHFNKPFIRAIYLGKNTYLVLTDAGNLATVWLDEATKIQHIMHKQPSGIRDIAVDNSYQTAAGFKPRIAYVNNGGEVFVTDLTRFGNSITMMHHSTVESPSTIFRFFYDKSKLAVLHRTEKGYGDLTVWPDNLGPLYLKTVVAQKMRQQKNS